jgi:competence protein ComEA
MCADTARRDRALRAALGVSAALYILAVMPALAPEAACPQPAEIRAEAGHTSLVQCTPGGEGAPLRGPARRLFGMTIDPNLADAQTLETLPGIGTSRAAAILHVRSERPFAVLDDLLRVPGVGPRTLARLRPLLAIDSADRAPVRETR